MKTNPKTKAERWEDLIFNQRNQAYGAYVIRKTQDQRTTAGLFFSTGSLLILALSVFFHLQKSYTTLEEPYIPEKGLIKLDKPPLIEIEKIAPSGGGEKPQKAKTKIPDELKPLLAIANADEKDEDEKTEDEKEVQDLNQNFSNDGDQSSADDKENFNAGPSGGSQAGIGISTGDGIINWDSFEDDIVRPGFAGGETAMVRFLRNNIQMPYSGEREKEHLVHVIFIVDEFGMVSDAKILRSAGTIYDDEALRVVSKMPNWVPGTHGGRKAKFRLILPIKFLSR
jgi:protein TonB